MPIVFEEVDATVQPAHSGTPQAQAAQPGAGTDTPEERADALRHALALMAERALRLKAD